MGEKDTDVILGLDFDTSDAVKRAENLGDELDKAINKNKNSKDSKVLKLTDELGQCREKAQNLMDELSRIEEETKVPTEEYKQLTDSLTSSKERMDELVNSARNVRTEINNVKKASEELEGKDVSLGTTKMREELERVESQMVRVNNNMSDFERAGQTESDAYQKLVLKAAELEQRAYESEIKEQEANLTALKKQLEEEKALSERANRMAWSNASDLGFEGSDRELLACLIYCEAGNQPYIGQVAVGSVVVNRMRSAAFPNTMVGVIYQKRQFSPVGSGRLATRLSLGATESCYRAADEAMAGVQPVGNCLFFRTVIPQIKGTIIGGHVFY